MNPTCDENPEHGEMQTEPMYGADGETVIQYGYFCKVKGCTGYGGPAQRKPPKKPATPQPSQNQQLTFDDMEAP